MNAVARPEGRARYVEALYLSADRYPRQEKGELLSYSSEVIHQRLQSQLIAKRAEPRNLPDRHGS